MRRHMCDNHPSKLLYLSARIFYGPPNRLRTDSVEETAIVDVAEEMHMNLKLMKCPYTEDEINFMGPMLLSYVKNKANEPTRTAPLNTINIDSMTYRLKRSEGPFLTLDDYVARAE